MVAPAWVTVPAYDLRANFNDIEKYDWPSVKNDLRRGLYAPGSSSIRPRWDHTKMFIPGLASTACNPAGFAIGQNSHVWTLLYRSHGNFHLSLSDNRDECAGMVRR
jgi:hypothetical protein